MTYRTKLDRQFWGWDILGENRGGKLVKSDPSWTRADILCTEAKQQHVSKLCSFTVHERVNTHSITHLPLRERICANSNTTVRHHFFLGFCRGFCHSVIFTLLVECLCFTTKRLAYLSIMVF